MLYREAYEKLRRDPLVVACTIVIAVFCVLALLPFTGLIGDLEQVKGCDEFTHIERSFHPPTPLLALGVVDSVNNQPLTDEQRGAFDGGLVSLNAWRLPLGADRDGRSVLGMSIHGIQLAFVFGLITTLISIIVAVPIGAAAGYFGGLVDDVIVWVYTTLLSIPFLLVIIALMAALKTQIEDAKPWLKLLIVLTMIGVTTWVTLARLIRAEFMKHKHREYVQAARALGFGHSRIIFSHIFPNTLHIVIITFTISFISAIHLEVFLSFIGIGIPPTTPTWGQMIAQAKGELTRDPSVWWPLTAATAFLFVLSLAFSIVGDALRDALDPKLRT